MAAVYSGSCSNLNLVSAQLYQGTPNISWSLGNGLTAGTYYLRLGQNITGVGTQFNLLIESFGF